jgi:ATP-dependent exoDNAse (exonuclease V) beta subunit
MPKPKAQVKGARSFPRLERRKPSEHGGLLICGEDLFAAHSTLATQFGSEVHKAFECIEWWNNEARTQLEKQRLKISKAVEAVERCFGNAAIAADFTADPSAKVWRERAFEAMVDGELCSGVFDRVVMRMDCAEIVDFKTDRVQDEAELTLAVDRHRLQLDWYRRVLMQMTGLAADQITCRLLFTHIQRVVEV